MLLRRRAGFFLITVVTGLLTLAGCGAAARGVGTPRPVNALGGSSDDPSAAPNSTAAKRLWTTLGDPFSSPVAIGGVAVVMAKDGNSLTIVGIDPLNGDMLWIRPASPGQIAPYYRLGPILARDGRGHEWVAYLEPTSTKHLSTRVIIADPRTGRTVHRSNNLFVVTPLMACDDGTDICFTAQSGPDEPWLDRRFHLADGALGPARSGAPAGATPLGAGGLMDVGDQDTQTLGRASAGLLLWRANVQDLFGPDFDLDNGRTFTDYPEFNTMVGSVEHSYDATNAAGDVTQFDLAETVTAGIDRRTGRRLWIDRGSTFQCWGRTHLMHAAVTSNSNAGDYFSPAPEYPVRCRGHGQAKVDENDPNKSFSFTDVNISIEGFNPHTGATTWSIPLGNITDLADDTAEDPAILDGQTISLRTPHGQIAVNLVTGHSRPLTINDILVAPQSFATDYQTPYQSGDYKSTQRWGAGALAYPENMNGPYLDKAPSLGALANVGAQVKGRVVVAIGAGWAGYGPATGG